MLGQHSDEFAYIKAQIVEIFHKSCGHPSSRRYHL